MTARVNRETKFLYKIIIPTVSNSRLKPCIEQMGSPFGSQWCTAKLLCSFKKFLVLFYRKWDPTSTKIQEAPTPAKINLSMPTCWAFISLWQNLPENWVSKQSFFVLILTTAQKKIFFRNKTFLFFKIESWNFQVHFEIEFHETLQNFSSIR